MVIAMGAIIRVLHTEYVGRLDQWSYDVYFIYLGIFETHLRISAYFQCNDVYAAYFQAEYSQLELDNHLCISCDDRQLLTDC
jgi:hypothetical protein